ncbi:MAG TPA: allene oxide cyclase family protein [Steroidobacteraceae bacterium]|nr:allene oxide cyclase family protein [Steroidobacteraceae bacterium]
MLEHRFASAALAALALAPPAFAARTLHFVEHALTDRVLHLGAKADSRGDLLTFANPVFNAANKAQVGTDQGFCIRVVTGKSWECFWTLLLGNGQITVEGPFHDAGDSILTVTGGTGAYDGARGSMRLHSRNAKATSYDFVYRLL